MVELCITDTMVIGSSPVNVLQNITKYVFSVYNVFIKSLINIIKL